MKKDTIKTATVFALLTTFISGVSLFINKFAVTAIKDPILFTMLKNSLVAVGLVGVVILLGKLKEVRSLSRSQNLRLLVIGFIGGALPFALFFTGLAQTNAVNGAFIHKTLFLWVALLAISFLKEKMVWQQWAGVGAVFIGNLFIGGFTGFKFNFGELMILGATILWAVETIIAKKVLGDVSSVIVGAARMVVGSILLIIYIFIFGSFAPIFSLTTSQWGWTLLTGLLLISYVISWYAALKRAPATYVATLLVPATIITNLLSALFITHTITYQNLASMFMYSLGIFLLVFFANKTVKNTGLIQNKKTFSVNT